MSTRRPLPPVPYIAQQTLFSPHFTKKATYDFIDKFFDEMRLVSLDFEELSQVSRTYDNGIVIKTRANQTHETIKHYLRKLYSDELIDHVDQILDRSIYILPLDAETSYISIFFVSCRVNRYKLQQITQARESCTAFLERKAGAFGYAIC